MVPLKVEYSGCQAVLKGPVCVLDPKKPLTIWVMTDRLAKISVHAGKQSNVRGPFLIQGGQRYQVDPDREAPELSVEATVRGARSVWRLRLSSPEPVTWIEQARELASSDKIDEAVKSLHAHLKTASPAHLAKANSLLARLALMTGAKEIAQKHFRTAMPLHRACGQVSALISDATALAHNLLYHGRRFTEAHEVLALVMDEAHTASARELFLVIYTQGLAASNTGDLRTAMDRLNTAHLLAKRLDLVDLQLISGQVLARHLQLLGRRTEASDLFDQLWLNLPIDAPPCQRALLLNNRGWARILTLEAGETPSGSPVPLLTQALAVLENDCTELPQEIINVRINLSLAHLHEGRLHQAVDEIKQVRAISQKPDTRFVLWILDIQARLALAEDKPQSSLLLYQKLQELAQSSQDPLAHWRAMVGLARTFQKMAKLPLALWAYTQAEQLLDEASMWVSIGDGRAGFLAQRKRCTQEHVDLLLKMKKKLEALRVVRMARARGLKAVWQADRLGKLSAASRKQWDQAMAKFLQTREELDATTASDWRLPADQLAMMAQIRKRQHAKLRKLLDQAFQARTGRQSRPDSMRDETLAWAAPQQQEVLLTYFPIKNHWVGFAYDSQGVESKSIGELDPNATAFQTADKLLQPFSKQIQRNRRVRILPCGNLSAVDFHALPWRGEVLLASKQVVYSLDLPGGSHPSKLHSKTDPTRFPKALLVIDPGMDLPRAEQEARRIQIYLEQAKPAWKVVLLGGRAANPAAVRKELGNASLFHYSGHAVFRGHEGWDSALKLAEGAEFGIGDILSFEKTPKRVVLMGCETGRATQASSAVPGLAQAFLMAGTSLVVAATRRVADSLATAFAEALYQKGDCDPAGVETFRQAQLKLKDLRPKQDWANFRILLP